MDNYLRNMKLPSHVNHLKLDIGLSYSAPQSQTWLEHEPDLFVIGFEPNPDCVASLNQDVIQKKNPGHGDPLTPENKKRFFLIPVALGNVETPGEMNFYQMANDCGTSSLYSPVDGSLGQVKNVVRVHVFSLKDFFESFPWGTNNIHHIDYIKIDAQGSDLDILKGAGRYLRDRVVYVTAEAEHSQYANCSHNNEVNMTQYMDSIGFDRIFHADTQDPTFLNRIYKHLMKDIYIYQKG